MEVLREIPPLESIALFEILQPIVLRDELKNLPAEALYSWQPTSLIGIYRIDEIFWASAERRDTQTQ